MERDDQMDRSDPSRGDNLEGRNSGEIPAPEATAREADPGQHSGDGLSRLQQPAEASYSAVDDEITAAQRDPDFESARGLEAMARGEEFQFALHPVRRTEVIVPAGSPLAGNTPEGSPSRRVPEDAAGRSAPTRAETFRVEGESLLQRVGARGWEDVTSDTTRSRVGYAIAAFAEGVGRFVRQPYAVAGGTVANAATDMVNRGVDIYKNFTADRFDGLAATGHLAEIAALTMHGGAAMTVASGASWQRGQGPDESARLVFDGEKIRQASFMSMAGGAMYLAGAYMNSLSERRERARARDIESGDLGRDLPPGERAQAYTSGAATMSSPFVRGRAPQEPAPQEGQPSRPSSSSGQGQGRPAVRR